MSAWIKFEKDVRTDPRFLRMCRAHVTQERINAPLAATQLVGALVTLWCYADTHIREDDTLDLGSDEIDELVGIQGFVALMPTDWLEVIDAHCVKLPGFQEHNGTEAKKRALTQKRVARHRVRNVTHERSNHPSSGNAIALPDQTRLDQKEDVPQGGTNGHSHEPDPVATVFEHWQSTHGHPKAKLDDKRRKVIRQALKHYSVEDLQLAINGYKASSYHQGKNENKAVYDDIELILRDAKHIDAGIAFSSKPETGVWM